ncbi:exonuclease [Gordonia phage Smoothie]|uniref:Exonuclease VII n=1 Tax=Gordonia phage Smoothie TaxID=1838078 RepID=A0A160DEI5_9CAUD|nr:exonuclease [Gordonia phage Smoothie]ANA86222.1 exonuclease VII [Gordonia phage Smoothie]
MRTPSYEQSLAELEGIVSTIASGKLTMDELFPAWERALELKKVCKQHLRVAHEKLERVSSEVQG